MISEHGSRELTTEPQTTKAAGSHSVVNGEASSFGNQVKKWRSAASWVLVVVLVALFVRTTYFKDEGFVNSREVWNTFHYYLGAKYFHEVGYFSLYTCALEADYESAGYWNWIPGVRDLETYRMVPRPFLPPCPQGNFTPARWDEFTRDVEHFAELAPEAYYSSGVFADKGFNPPPSWVAIAMPLARAVPIAKSRTTDFLFNVDVVAVLIGIVVIWRNYGRLPALITSALSTLYFGNLGRIGGNFLQYTWFPFLILAFVLWNKHRPALSGATLGLAVGLQAFPIFFSLPIIARGAFAIFTGKKEPEWRPHLWFTCALGTVLFSSFLVGCFAGGGTEAWSEWQRKISIHKNYLRGEIFDIGLANLSAASVSKDHENTEDYQHDIPKTFLRGQEFKKNIWVYYVFCAGFVALWLMAVLRSPHTGLFSQGFLVMYALVSMSPYYYFSLALLPLMCWNAGRMLRNGALWGTVVLFALHLLYFRGGYVSFTYWPHLLSECSLALLLLALSAACAFSHESDTSGVTGKAVSQQTC